ncbi:MAG: class C sortase [Lachnospiraceae bacterium]
MRKRIITWMVILIFFIGLSIFLYPMLSNLYNRHMNYRLISQYNEMGEVLTEKEYNVLLEDAHTYNKYLNNKQKLTEMGLSYESVLNPQGDGMMGYLSIPKISVQLPIYHTLSETVLQTGVGHSEDSALPVGGRGTHCVLAGHTGLPSAKLLTNIDRLQINDRFELHVLGDTLTYRVDDIAVVEPQDTSRLRARRGKDYVTIVTCTPYGVNTHRLLVRGIRVHEEMNHDSSSLNLSNEMVWIEPLYLVTISIVVLSGFSCIVLYIINRKRKKDE